jgi:hypothetical protein
MENGSQSFVRLVRRNKVIHFQKDSMDLSFYGCMAKVRAGLFDYASKVSLSSSL